MATVNDIVLIHLEESPVCFARIESILPDAKKDWFHIKLLMLQIPLKAATWILKDEYINGADFFMNGKQMRLQKIECPAEHVSPDDPVPLPPKKKVPAKNDEKADDRGKIISFSDLKNKETK